MFNQLDTSGTPAFWEFDNGLTHHWQDSKEGRHHQPEEWVTSRTTGAGGTGDLLFFCQVPDNALLSRPLTYNCMLRRWSEGSCWQVLLHTCNSGEEIPELSLLLLHLAPPRVIVGSFPFWAFVQECPWSSSLTIWLCWNGWLYLEFHEESYKTW